MISEEQLAEWQSLCDAATEWPWEALRLGEGTPQIKTPLFGFNCWTDWPDRVFIAASRTALPALLAEVRRLRAELATAREEEREACAKVADESAQSFRDSIDAGYKFGPSEDRQREREMDEQSGRVAVAIAALVRARCSPSRENAPPAADQ